MAAELLSLTASTEADTLVFFRAGAAKGHDSIAKYKSVLLPYFSGVCILLFKDATRLPAQGLHVFAISALISRAELVVALSLHCRILALAYSHPRVTWWMSASTTPTEVCLGFLHTFLPALTLSIKVFSFYLVLIYYNLPITYY